MAAPPWPLHLPPAGQHWEAPHDAGYSTPGRAGHSTSQWGYAAGPGPAAATPPVYCTDGQLTLDSSSPSKSGSRGSQYSGAPGSTGTTARASYPPPAQGPALHRLATAQPPLLPSAAAYARQLEQQNMELLRRCQELQDQLEAAAAAPAPSTQTSPTRSASTQLGPSGDPEVERELQRRLAAKQREAEAAAAALATARHVVAQREAQLEQERGRAAELADELAQCRDELLKRGKEAKSLQQRLEAATSHAGMLDDAATALRKQGSELSKALAQRDVTIRGLEDRLRALQGSEGSRDKQLEAAHSDNAALRQQVAALEAEAQRLQAALGEARAQVAAQRARNRELELAAQDGSGATPHHNHLASGMYGPHTLPDHQIHEQNQSQEQFAAHNTAAMAAERYGRQPTILSDPAVLPAEPRNMPVGSVRYQQGPPDDPRASLQQYTWQQYNPTDDSCAVRASYANGVPRAAFQQYNQPAGTPAPPAGCYPAAWSAPYGSMSNSMPSDSQPKWDEVPPLRYQQQNSFAALPPVQQHRYGSSSDGGSSCQQRQGSSEASEAEVLSSRLGSVQLGTPTVASPFGTDDTLQDMLTRTQALEAHLLELNAERNELEAESARMPAHTAGRTLQERRRRAEVERRLEEIGKECSSVRLQLRRLGVK